MSLSKLQESDLSAVLENPNDWGMPVVLKGPTGATQTVNGQVLRDSIMVNPETGEPVLNTTPVVTLRISSLNPVPQNGEKWYIEIPSTPDPASAKLGFLADGSKAFEFWRSFGIVKIRLTPAVQS